MTKESERLLRDAVERRGYKQVARELGRLQTTVHLVLKGRYGASTEAFEKRVMSIYGSSAGVSCPFLGKIDPARCAETYDRAKKLGLGMGSPDTLRLHHGCLNSKLRS